VPVTSIPQYFAANTSHPHPTPILDQGTSLAASVLLPPASSTSELLQVMMICVAILNFPQVCAGHTLQVRVTWVVDRFSFAIVNQA
jgi:hypothetical protein